MKRLLFFTLLTGWAFTLSAQDIIIKENGDEIKTKIIEVSSTEVKYKKFGNESGPTFVMLKSEIFMIKYANGDKEVIPLSAARQAAQQQPPQQQQQQAYAAQPQQQQQQAYAAQPQQQQQAYAAQPRQAAAVPEVQDDSKLSYGAFHRKYYKHNAFGLNLGVGFGDNITMADLGVGYLHNWMPFLGTEFVKLRLGGGVAEGGGTIISTQLMTGLRGTIPLGRSSNKAAFLAFRIGAGGLIGEADDLWGVCTEYEFGLHLTRTFYFSMLINSQNASGYLPYTSTGLRVGFLFGRTSGK
ncbi:MAG: hypothetical protein LBL94_07880 [Prevotellaceae bacterium]|nr:hypothetical protein [Prevotellaceae bacterium]